MTPLLEMRGIGKRFPGVRALDDVSITVQAGEVLALVGENGAGKSTLMKILAGALRADSGEILLDGRPVRIESPRDAERLGIGMIYQELVLVPELDAVRNVVLGDEPMRGPFLDEARAHDRARAAFAELGIEIPFGVPVKHLSVGQQQMVEIVKALSKRARILVMDEPSAALTEPEIERLFALIKRLTASGAGIIYISHRLEELPRIADRVTVLRDGQVIETRPLAAFPQDEIVRAMVGRRLDAHFPALPAIADDAPVMLEVRDLRRPPSVNGVSFSVRAGEIVGLAGLIGAGRTEIVRAIACADVPLGGTVAIEGRPVFVRRPSDAIAAGIVLVPEDRKTQGLVLGMSIRENVTMAHLQRFLTRLGLIDVRRESAQTRHFIEELRIRATGPEQQVGTLSGGTQQKVVLARWLLGKARVFLFDEPTRGIDVAAKAEIYALMVELLRGGAAIVMVSSELPEVLGMSHRVLVVRGGRIVRELSRSAATPEAVIAAAAGGRAA